MNEASWDDIASHGEMPPHTDAQKAELDRRLAQYLAKPDDVISWDEVRAAVFAKIRQ